MKLRQNTPGSASISKLDPDWWRQAVVYEVYPRSFADGDADGVGDLAGLLGRIDYFASLGIDAVWLAPFFPSALVDGGYDVDDYRAVDPTIGTLEEFDEFVQGLHARGINLIIDIVPNHSSNRHAWFQAALAAGPGSPERDRYIFRDGRGPQGDEPPSDWESGFGGLMWSRVEDGEWYFHLCAPEQPDFNWDNDDVRQDFLETLRFWGDRGVDGFRVDVAMGLAKDFPEELPSWERVQGAADVGAVTGVAREQKRPIEPYADGQHPFFDRDEVHDIYAEWRKVFNSYDPPLFAVAEVVVAPHRRIRYASSEGLGQAFSFDLMGAAWDPVQFRTIIDGNLALSRESGASSTWVFNNHDLVRLPTRYGMRGRTATEWLLAGGDSALEDRELGLARAKAATLLAMALPGSMYLYQGEELGLPEVGDLPVEAKRDPAFLRNPAESPGRDGCRVPLPWTRSGTAFGFSAGEPHLPQPSWFADYAVDGQESDPDSTLSLYRRAIALRRQLRTDEELEWLDVGADAVGFRRPNGWISVTNFGDQPLAVPYGEVILSTRGLEQGRLPGGSTAWLMGQ